MRIRTVKPEFWSHPVMARLDPRVQLLALALLNYADDEGYFRASPPLVRAACCPFTEDSVRTHGWLTTLSEVGWIEVCVHPIQGPIGRVINFTKHQTINRASDSKIKTYWITERSVSTHGALSEPSLLEQGTGNREQGTGNIPDRSGDEDGDEDDGFDSFWDAYGKKTGKALATKAWKRLSVSDRKAAMDGVAAYLVAKPDPQFRKDPERYLKHRVWEDEQPVSIACPFPDGSGEAANWWMANHPEMLGRIS